MHFPEKRKEKTKVKKLFSVASITSKCYHHMEIWNQLQFLCKRRILEA